MEIDINSGELQQSREYISWGDLEEIQDEVLNMEIPKAAEVADFDERPLVW